MLADNILLQEGVIPRLLGGLWVTVEIGFLHLIGLVVIAGVLSMIYTFYLFARFALSMVQRLFLLRTLM